MLVEDEEEGQLQDEGNLHDIYTQSQASRYST